MADLLTGSILKKICPSMSLDVANKQAALISSIAPIYGINTADILRELLANMAEESGEFSIKVENMNYTTPQRIVDVWPSRFNLTGQDGKLNANNYTRNPKLLANTVYNGRMGNVTGTDDGYNFRGAGRLQMTGRETISKYAAYKNVTPEIAANNLQTDDKWAIDGACWEFAISLKLIPLAIGDNNFTKIVKLINGGFIGLPERQKYFERCKQYLV